MTFAIYPQAAPNAAKRFLELVESGFYNNTPIFRVVPGFVAQFGINWRPKHRDWKENNFKDDPSLFKLSEGTLAFAKAGKDTNSCQVFINYGDNSRLAKSGGFSTFGKVVSNFGVAKKFRSVGDPSMGLDQDWLWSKGESYLEAISEKPDMIISASLVQA
jgi:cyclophilin family peptidyl-prolyl cis-trans isomerase